MASARPTPLQWVWYAYGGGLPEYLREWVLHDLTCRTWVLRHFSRTLAQWVPSLVLMLLPGPLSLRVSLPLVVLLGALYVSASYIEETCEHRLAKHGFPLGMAKEMRLARVEIAAMDDERRRVDD
ncbi:MAG TPA: DUF5313 family protein [Pseudonocardiaceae bacterium]|jgi:hypothetical protein|nr:DUF5313 family protein [Pseudonocardiaceae bacterium]